MKLRVRSVTWEAEGILSFVLVGIDGQPLPAFEAGAHIDVRIPGGLSRRYSLCNAPGDTTHYQIAVLHVPDSRGGSRAMHERVRPGDVLEVSEPHNFFPLHEEARTSVLIAGGIGITPLLAMMERLLALGRDFRLHYCTTSPERTAFAQRLGALVIQGRVQIHHDGGNPGKGLDIAALLKARPEGAHLYYCGPNGFMRAVESAASHWPADSVHCEYFGAAPTSVAPGTNASIDDERVPVELLKSGRTIHVHASQTLLAALREAGVPCESSCEAGMCGTCKVAYTGGPPEHHDLVLSEDEQAHAVLTCCARTRVPLALDL